MGSLEKAVAAAEKLIRVGQPIYDLDATELVRAVLLAVRPETDDSIDRWMACEFIDQILQEKGDG
jgi:hypothetical protein